MARIAGRNGRLYVAIGSGATSAEPVAFLNKWTLEGSSDRFEVTAFGDTGKTYVAGLPDARGTYGGFYDTATAQLWTAAVDGVARRFYLYPDITTTPYWFGTAFFDMSLEGDVGGSVNISGTWSAASTVAKQT